MPTLSLRTTWRSLRRNMLRAMALLALLPALPASAQDDPPARVGRVAEVQGGVSWYDAEQGSWAAAERNRPLTTGDRLSTAAGARVELRVGSTTLRLGPGSEMEMLRLDDERVVVQLHSGSLALRLRSREAADETEVHTAEARLLPQRAGHYRFDRIDDTTEAGTWRGELRVDTPSGLEVGAGQRVALTRLSRGGLRADWESLPDDAFAAWVSSEDQRDERSASTRYVSPEMTGAEDLDRYGRWSTHPEFGAVWFPLEVRAGWEPYRHGRWAWVRPWGWTWIDEAPWGFAPFHYGRWVSWSGRWCWVPGAYVASPVYAPALVAWGGGVNVSVNIGSPPVRWAPLAPREVYRPHYRVSPIYVERINPVPHYGWRRDPDRGRVGVEPIGRDVPGHPPRDSRPAPGPRPGVSPAPPVMHQPAPRPPERDVQRIPERRVPERWREQRPPEQTQPVPPQPQPQPGHRPPAQQPAQPQPAQPQPAQPQPAPRPPADRGHDRPAPREGAGGRVIERVREGREADDPQRQRRPEAKPEGRPAPRERGENQR